MTSIRGFLEKRMRLQVNEEKSGVRKPNEVHFLGFRFHCRTGREGDDVAIHPSAKAERRLRTTLREMTPPNWGRSITSCMDNVSRYTTGWMSHYRLCTPEAVQGLGAIDAHIRRRVRAIRFSERSIGSPFAGKLGHSRADFCPRPPHHYLYAKPGSGCSGACSSTMSCLMLRTSKPPADTNAASISNPYE